MTTLKNHVAAVCRFNVVELSFIYLPAENYGDPSDKGWSICLARTEKGDEQLTKQWSEDMSGLLVFVSCRLLSLFIPCLNHPVEERSSLGHCRDLPLVKRPTALS